MLAIVNVLCAEEPTVTLPKARLPVRDMIFVGVAVPVPEAAMVLPPLVASEFTVTVPPYVVADVGEKVTVTGWEPPAAIVPDQAPLKPLG